MGQGLAKEGIIVKMSKSGCHPHFFHLTFRTITPSKSYILLSIYSTIFFSRSSHHWASSYLLFHLHNLCSIWSTNAWNSSSKVARFNTWLKKMFIALCCESMLCCGKSIKPKLEVGFTRLQIGCMLYMLLFA